MKTLLLTGASGFIAGSVLAQRPSHWRIVALSRTRPEIDDPRITWSALPPSLTREDVAAWQPDAVLHTAAIAAIDHCEAHPDEADAVNVGLTETLLAGAELAGARFMFLSTDNVFDGEDGGYTEDCPPRPVNHYGVTKARAEAAVLDRCTDGLVARVSVVMGLPMVGSGNSFLSRMIPTLASGEPLGVPEDEIRSPIDIVTLGRALWELADHECRGILHLSGNDWLTRCAMVQEIAAALGYARDQVYPNDPTVIPGRAPRPRDASLDNARARQCLRTPLCGFQEGMGRILRWRDHGTADF